MPHVMKRMLIYAALIVWTIIALFPIFWTFSTTFKVAKDVQLGHIIPWIDFKPAWLGLRAIGFSPDTLFTDSTPREEFLKRFWNSIQASIGGSALALDRFTRRGPSRSEVARASGETASRAARSGSASVVNDEAGRHTPSCPDRQDCSR